MDMRETIIVWKECEVGLERLEGGCRAAMVG